MKTSTLVRIAPIMLMALLGSTVSLLVACGQLEEEEGSSEDAICSDGYGGSSGYGGYGYGGSSGYGGSRGCADGGTRTDGGNRTDGGSSGSSGRRADGGNSGSTADGGR